MECKFNYQLYHPYLTAVEVAPYWNVNKENNTARNLAPVVEVAPYWNVNSVIKLLTLILFIVEVAPYWNVNSLFTFLGLTITS